MNMRLDATRQRTQACKTEIQLMQGNQEDREKTEMQIAQDEHAALQSENALLNEDNQLLREETFALEEQIDEIREELNQKDWVSGMSTFAYAQCIRAFSIP